MKKYYAFIFVENSINKIVDKITNEPNVMVALQQMIAQVLVDMHVTADMRDWVIESLRQVHPD